MRIDGVVVACPQERDVLMAEDKGETRALFVVKEQTRATKESVSPETESRCCYNRICYRQRSTTNTLRSFIRSGGLLA